MLQLLAALLLAHSSMLLAEVQPSSATHAKQVYPHWQECSLCQECLADNAVYADHATAANVAADLQHAAASSAHDGMLQVQARKLEAGQMPKPWEAGADVMQPRSYMHTPHMHAGQQQQRQQHASHTFRPSSQSTDQHQQQPQSAAGRQPQSALQPTIVAQGTISHKYTSPASKMPWTSGTQSHALAGRATLSLHAHSAHSMHSRRHVAAIPHQASTRYSGSADSSGHIDLQIGQQTQQQQQQQEEVLRPTGLGSHPDSLTASHSAAAQQYGTDSMQHSTPSWRLWPADMPHVMSGAELGQLGAVAQLIMHAGSQDRAHLPNCTVCRGCNARLQDIGEQAQHFERVRFQHHQGDSATWVFFAWPAGSATRYVVKVFCMPFDKPHSQQQEAEDGVVHGAAWTQSQCTTKTYEQRIRAILAVQQIMEDCGAADMAPKVWLAPLSATIPGLGYHISAYALWQEEAAGITLQGLQMAADGRLMHELLMHRMNRTQVLMAGVLDLLTGQCDRHAGNVFIDTSGRLQLIDNDKSLGSVPGCGYDSMFLPGSRYHWFMRAGPHNGLTQWYRQHAQGPRACHGPVYAQFVLDYRCGVLSDNDQAGTTPATTQGAWRAAAAAGSGQLHTRFPPALSSCLTQLRVMGVKGIMKRYGLTRRTAAQVLYHRASDMLDHGLEWTMQHGKPRNSPRFNRPRQPACCGLKMGRYGMTCDECWWPDLPDI